MSRGYTLLELATVLVLVAIATSLLVPAGRDLRDSFAVSAGREALAGLIAEARSAAPARGGAAVRVQGGPWRAWATGGTTLLRTVELERELGVTVELSRGRTSLELRFDALGLGQVASETVVLARGEHRRTLVVSSYGRVRRP